MKSYRNFRPFCAKKKEQPAVRMAAVFLWLVVLATACGNSLEDSRQLSQKNVVQTAAGVAAGQNDRPVPPQFCIVTHYSAGQAPYASIAVRSHSRYAQRHGYLYAAYTARLSGEAFLDPASGPAETLRGGGLYWQKLTAVANALQDGLPRDDGQQVRCDWVMWIDSDAVFTNETIELENIVREHARPSTNVLLAGEAVLRINSGVFLVRNSVGGNKFIKDVAALYPTFKDRRWPDQEAITAVAFAGKEACYNAVTGTIEAEQVRDGFSLTLPRVFNSCTSPYGPSHPLNQWQPCDFVAHLAGVRTRDRPEAMEAVLASRHSCE